MEIKAEIKTEAKVALIFPEGYSFFNTLIGVCNFLSISYCYNIIWCHQTTLIRKNVIFCNHIY